MMIKESFKAITFAVSLLTLIFASCTRTIYEPIEIMKVEKATNTVIKTDTVERYRDRVVEKRGDTVYVTTLEYRYKSVHDTSYVDRNIEIEVPKIVEVPIPQERELTQWQKARLNLFPWLCAIVSLCVIWLLRKPLLRLITKKIL